MKKILFFLMVFMIRSASAQMTVSIISSQCDSLISGTFSDVSLSLNTSGGQSPYTYSWSTGAVTSAITVIPVTDTVYSVTVTDHLSATATDSKEMFMFYCAEGKWSVDSDTLPVGTTWSDDTLVSDTSHLFLFKWNGTTSPLYHYFWDFGDGDTSHAISVSHQYPSPGIYYINARVEISNGCNTCSTQPVLPFFIIIIKNSVGIADIEKEIKINIAPNPVKDLLSIETPPSLNGGTVSILNINGQELLNQRLYDSKAQLDLRNLNNGIYLIKIVSEDKVVVRKFVKE
jgi:hypothetical protein